MDDSEPTVLNPPNLLTSDYHNIDLQQLDWGIIDSLLSGGDHGASSTAVRSGINNNGEEMKLRDEIKKCRGGKKRRATRHRIAFRTRSSEDVLDDGFRWRKYGQKAVKNSIYPRSYYRCAHHTCNVKKQVQRLSEEATMVLTTYDGRHNHLPEQLMETLAPLLRQIQFLSRF